MLRQDLAGQQRKAAAARCIQHVHTESETGRGTGTDLKHRRSSAGSVAHTNGREVAAKARAELLHPFQL